MPKTAFLTFGVWLIERIKLVMRKIKRLLLGIIMLQAVILIRSMIFSGISFIDIIGLIIILITIIEYFDKNDKNVEE